MCAKAHAGLTPARSRQHGVALARRPSRLAQRMRRRRRNLRIAALRLRLKLLGAQEYLAISFPRCPQLQALTTAMTHEKIARHDRAMFKSVLAKIAENLAQQGETDFSPKRLLREFRALVDAAHGLSDEHQIVIDHTDVLLRHAREFGRSGEARLACIFYATWVEHRLNSYCSLLATRHRLPPAELDQIVRGTSIQAKMAWLHLIVGRGLSKAATVQIVKLSELRNAFVHYKWRAASEELEHEYDAMITRAERLVRQFQHYERKHLGHISRRKAHSLASEIRLP